MKSAQVPQMSDLSAIGWYHLVVFGLIVPALAVRSRQRIALASSPPLDRLRHFRSTAFMLVLFAVLSLVTARRQYLDLFPFDPKRIAVAVPVGMIMYVAAVTLMRPRWRRAVGRRARIVHLFMPQTATERAWWIGVSVLAGVSEEITWRGVQTTLLAVLLGNVAAAAIVSAVMFGFGHYAQGWKAASIIALFALAFQGLVWLSGSLYIAMAVHIAYDITAGINYGRLGRDLRYQPSAS